MPRKSTRGASGSSPEKPTATSRRNTRRGQKSETEVVDEIPAHLLRASDESSEQSDNDSDYGSPKKGRGRGRGRKAKEPVVVQEEKPVAVKRSRRGRRGAQSPVAEEQHSQEEYQESANSQTTNDEHDASTMESEPAVEKEKSPEPAEPGEKEAEKDEDQAASQEEKEVEPENDKTENTDEDKTEPKQTTDEKEEPQKEEEIATEVESPPKEPALSEQVDVIEKVSDVTEIAQDLQSNNDQAPVNEEVAQVDETDKNVDKRAESPNNTQDDGEVISADIDDDKQDDSVDDEVSKDAPELPMDDDSRSRSNSTERGDEKPEKVKEQEKRRRSRSSSGEIHEESYEKMDVDSSIDILNKHSQSSEKDASRTEQKSPVKAVDDKPQASGGGVQRKRKWGARKTDDEPVIAITTDSLKNVIAEEVKPVDVKLASSPSPEPEEKRQRVKLTSEDRDVKKKLLKERLRKQEEEEERRNEQIAKAMERSQVSPTIIVTNGAGKERKVSVINADDGNVSPAKTPPKSQMSKIICITNLVRPLTFMAIKALVARTGEIEDFWIDAIKSKCFVVYKTEDQAFETKQALNGVKWPDHNLKTLAVEFSTEEEMNKVIEATRGERISNDTTTSRETKPEKSFGWSKSEVPSEDRSRSSRRVREWDVGKKEEAERDEDRENRRRRRSSEQREKVKRRSVSKSPAREEQKEMTPVPQQRLLDDLFRKTKAVPFIYWMPLSEERIKELEEQRLKNIAEHNRRMDEMMKIQKERREAREQRMREDEKRRQERRERDHRRSRSRSKNTRRRSRDRSSRDRDRRRDRR